MNDGTVWIGTTHSGIYSFDGTNWINYTPDNSGLPDYFIRTITQDSIGDIWIGTVEGLARFDGTNWQVWTVENAALNSNNITSIAVGLDNTKYIGTINGGLIYYDNVTLTEYTLLEGGVPDNSSIGIVFDNQNLPWFASPSHGLFTEDGNQNWTSYTILNSPIISNGLTSIVVDTQNEFTLGTQESGLIFFTPPSQWSNMNASNSNLPDNHILSLYRNDESLWIGTNSHGLVKMTKNTTSLNEASEKVISYSPNPFNDFIQIESLNETDLIDIIDISGKNINDLIQQNWLSYSTAQINTSQLHQGIYLLVISTGNGIQTYRIIKN
jgi:ligand-binding sensor domain-containing protein